GWVFIGGLLQFIPSRVQIACRGGCARSLPRGAARAAPARRRCATPYPRARSPPEVGHAGTAIAGRAGAGVCLRRTSPIEENPMTTINVQKKGPAKETGLARSFDPFFDWEPMRRMRLFAWDPFAEMAELPSLEPQATFMPAFEVKETQDRFVFKADLPGIKE